MNDSLTKTNKPPIGGLKKGIAATRAANEQKIKELDPQTVPYRIGIVIDDSGSMGYEGMKDAHTAVRGFCNNCNNMDTSIAVYPLNVSVKPLICDYDIVTMYVDGLWATGGTPIFSILDTLINNEPITRAVLFSDGDPTDGSVLNKKTNNDFYYGDRDRGKTMGCIKKYTDKEIPIDTIYIGIEGTNGYEEMKEIARLTNGTFIHFKDTTSLSTGLKYLAPKYRALLANPDIKARIERGETV